MPNTLPCARIISMQTKFHKHKIENLIVIPKIVTIHYLEFDKFFTYGGESHNFWELVYADKNRVLIRAGDKDLILNEGEVIFHKPNEYHSLSSDRTSPPNIFIITFETRSEAMSFFDGRKLTLPPSLKPYIQNIISEARRTFAMSRQNPFITKMELAPEPALGGQQLIRLNLEQLLIYLIRHHNTPSQVFVERSEFEGRIVNDIIAVLEQNLYSKIAVNDICAMLNYGKTYLYKLFRAETGDSIMNHYARLKVKESKKLLRDGSLTVADISEMLGFSSSAHFCRVFKQYTGMTTAQYLRSCQVLADGRS